MILEHACGGGCGITIDAEVNPADGARSGPSGANTRRHWSRSDGPAPTIVASGRYTNGKAYDWDSRGDSLRRYLGFDTATNPTKLVGFFVLYLKALPGATYSCFDFALDGGSFGNFRIDTSGIIKAGFGTTLGAGVQLNLHQPYLIDYKVDVSTNPNKIDWRINTVAQAQVTRSQAATFIVNYRQGINTNGVSAWHRCTDMAISLNDADYPIGNIIVCTDRVTHDGTHFFAGANPNPEGGEDPAFNPSDFEYNDTSVVLQSAVDVFSYLDEFPPTTADFIAQTILNERSYIAIKFAAADFPYDAIGVEVVSVHHSGKKTPTSSDTTSNRQSMFLHDDTWKSAVFQDADMSHGPRMVFNSRQLTLHPSGKKWKKSQRDNAELRWGFGADVDSIPYLDNVALEWVIPIPSITENFADVLGDAEVEGDSIDVLGGNTLVDMSDGEPEADFIVTASYEFDANADNEIESDAILFAQEGDTCRAVEFIDVDDDGATVTLLDSSSGVTPTFTDESTC